MQTITTSPEQAFAGLLREARHYGDFISVEQLFVDYQRLCDAEMIGAAHALISVSALLHSSNGGFIVNGVTTETEVYFEAYRRAFFDAEHSERHGGTFVYSTPSLWQIVVEGLRGFLQVHRESLPPSARPRINTVTSLADRRA